MYCSNCGTRVPENARFCNSCGHAVKQVPEGISATVDRERSDLEAGVSSVVYTPQSQHRKTGWIFGIVVSAVIVAAGSAVTVYAKPFASGKQLLLDGMSSAAGRADLGTGTTQEKLTLKVQNVNVPGLGGVQAGLLSTLNDSTIDMNLLFNPTSKQAELDFSSDYQSITHQGSLWIDGNQAVLEASDYQSLLAPILPAGAELPKYLVTDSAQTQALQKFWQSVSAGSTQLSKSQQQAVITLERVLLQAIPDKYVHRSGLNSIQISFDQAGLEDILKSEVQEVYTHKTEVANALSALSQGDIQVQQTEVQQNVINALNQVPEEAAMAAVTTAFNSGVFSVEPNTIQLTKNLFHKGITESINGGISVRSPNMSMALSYQMSAQSQSSSQISIPNTSGSNTQTFSAWSSQMATLSGN